MACTETSETAIQRCVAPFDITEMSFTWCVQVLRSLKEAFAAAMQSWSESCEKCVCLQGDYIEK